MCCKRLIVRRRRCRGHREGAFAFVERCYVCLCDGGGYGGVPSRWFDDVCGFVGFHYCFIKVCAVHGRLKVDVAGVPAKAPGDNFSSGLVKIGDTPAGGGVNVQTIWTQNKGRVHVSPGFAKGAGSEYKVVHRLF